MPHMTTDWNDTDAIGKAIHDFARALWDNGPEKTWV